MQKQVHPIQIKSTINDLTTAINTQVATLYNFLQQQQEQMNSAMEQIKKLTPQPVKKTPEAASEVTPKVVVGKKK